MTQFLLASASPRRRELFALFGWPFDIASADVDEAPRANEPPDQLVARLADAKAHAIHALSQVTRTHMHDFILAADTLVSLDGAPLGKPTDAADAARLLRALRGRAHQVYTGLTVLDGSTGQALTAVAATAVPMRHYGDDEIAAYVASGDPLDKAGAYAIQHAGFHPVDSLRGCFANVMGLPLCHLARALRRLGAESPVDIAAACQQHIVYDCPVFASILETGAVSEIAKV